MRPLLVKFIGIAALAMSLEAGAHGGGLNKQGCHRNRATGDYHCHRGGSGPAASSAWAGSGNRRAPNTLVPAHAAPARPRQGGGAAFANCAAARAAGAAPVRRGDPGYGPHLDRDNDGVGCEPYRGR